MLFFRFKGFCICFLRGKVAIWCISLERVEEVRVMKGNGY